jgi:hypothetical protein
MIWAGAALALLVAGPLHAAAQAPGKGPPAKGGAGGLAPEYRQSWADYLAQKAKARPPKLPDWKGVWRRQNAGGMLFAFGDHETPSAALPRGYAQSTARLTPKYRAAYDQKIEQIRKGVEWDRLSYCLPVGMPRWLTEPWQRESSSRPPRPG